MAAQNVTARVSQLWSQLSATRPRPRAGAPEAACEFNAGARRRSTPAMSILRARGRVAVELGRWKEDDERSSG